MRKIFLFFISILIFSLQSFSQKNGTIKGVAFDTTMKEPVPGTTITLMKKKDSSLVTYKGRFELNDLPNGEYRILITHVNYHNANKLFTVNNEHKDINLGNIIMYDKNKVLPEVLVTAESAPVTLVGDTINIMQAHLKPCPMPMWKIF